MHMSYWFGTDVGTFMFDGYDITTTWGMVATCLGLASLAIVYEVMKLLQIKLRKMTLASLPQESSPSSENSSLLSRIPGFPQSRATTATYCGSCTRWLIEGLHWSLHTTLGYLLMLAVMSYNGYFSIALVIGSGLGYWIFGQTLVELNMKQLHHVRESSQCDPECSDASASTERRQSSVSVVAEQLAAEANVDVYV